MRPCSQKDGLSQQAVAGSRAAEVSDGELATTVAYGKEGTRRNVDPKV